MKEYHRIWLSTHPERSEEWLKKQLKDGFDIHHLDRNHANNDPLNLVLIEHCDHMRLHGMSINRLKYLERKKRRHKRLKLKKHPKKYSNEHYIIEKGIGGQLYRRDL